MKLKINAGVFIIFIFSAAILAQSSKKGPEAGSRTEYLEINAPSLKSFEKVRIGVYLPNGYETGKKNLPVIYYFVGFGQNETSWEEMGVKAILDELIEDKSVEPMIVVSPGSRDTGWLNWIDGTHQWETFITKDLIRAIDKNYRTTKKPCQRGISGNSAGGVGALKIGFERTDLFGSISAHSAGIQPADPEELPNWAKGWDGWEKRVGKPINLDYWQKQNPLYLAATLPQKQLQNQSIYFDVGDKDHLGFAKPNTRLSDILKDRRITHTFVLREGGHGSKFVKDNAKYALEFHGAVFRKRCGGKRITN